MIIDGFRHMNIGVAGDKYVDGKPLITSLLRQNGISAWDIKVKRSFFLFWPKKIEVLRLVDSDLISKSDIIHAVFPFHTIEAIILAKIFKKKVVFHWIGTDVWYIKGDLRNDFLTGSYNKLFYKLFYKLLGRFADYHLCGSLSLKRELEVVGIKAEILPILPVKKFNISKLPANITVYSYIPSTRPEFYGSKIFLRLAKEFKKIKFIASGGWRGEKVPNLEYLSASADMGNIYSKSSIVFRFPEHDGMSLVVLEALLSGREVIWNYRFPYCNLARNYREVKTVLKRLMNNPKINYAGAEYVAEHYNPQKTVEKLLRIYKKVSVL